MAIVYAVIRRWRLWCGVKRDGTLRFINFATDGGCSQKANAAELSGLLRKTAERSHEKSLQGMQETFPDVGVFALDGHTTLSTVDILFPMVDDPEIFGRVVVNHVLNDIYASLGVPRFGLAILGAPRGIAADDQIIVQLLAAATSAMKEAGASLVGGHSLGNQESLFLGFSVVGTPIKDQPVKKSIAQAGDSILMTKRLGTSIASLRWKLENVPLLAHEDVVHGMLQSAAQVSEIAARSGVEHCTDISGFGFVNNLVALLARAGVGATIDSPVIPIYESIRPYLGPEVACTRQSLHNMDFSMSRSVDLGALDRSQEAAWMDAQTSGGLLFICSAVKEECVTSELVANGVEVTRIGTTRDDGKLHFVS